MKTYTYQELVSFWVEYFGEMPDTKMDDILKRLEGVDIEIFLHLFD